LIERWVGRRLRRFVGGGGWSVVEIVAGFLLLSFSSSLLQFYYILAPSFPHFPPGVWGRESKRKNNYFQANSTGFILALMLGHSIFN
jgi:hypothetical protein